MPGNVKGHGLPPSLVQVQKTTLEQKFHQALNAHQQGQLAQAQLVYDEILKVDPNHANSLHFLGVCRYQNGQLEQAAELISRSIHLEPRSPSANHNYGEVLKSLARFDEAIVSYEKAISLKPDYSEAYNNRGIALANLKRLDEALASYEKAISLKANYANAYNNRGIVLADLKRLDEALASYEKAISLKPDYSEAYNNRGIVLANLKRLDEALASYEKAISLKPNYAQAYNNRGIALADLKRLDEALASYEKTISLKPDFAQAYNNRGVALADLKRLGEALASYEKAISLKPDYAEAYRNRGNILKDAKQLEEALASYNEAFRLNADLDFVYGDLIHLKMKVCKWQSLDQDLNKLTTKIQKKSRVVTPWIALTLFDSSDIQSKTAQIYAACSFSKESKLPEIVKTEAAKKLKIAYFSSDFRNHATSHLISEMLEAHNREEFELYAFTFGPDTMDDMRKRLLKAFGKFIDINGMSDQEAASICRQLGIDIAIDLNGATTHTRTGVFAQRCAPIQVSYLGFAGTSGTDFMDYIIADQVLIPAESRTNYSEKIVYLPQSYQANDSQRKISDRRFTKAELGIPEGSFVFCCFNNSFKIMPRMFDCWMRILQRVEGSILWLFKDNEIAATNLKREAEARGVYADRLIFAERMPLEEHLARHRSADLFLDTLPYNAHTTASDALWAGLPLITCMGESFAARVAASVLTTLNLPELIAEDLSAYEELAVALAKDPEKLLGIKQKLENERLSLPLFKGNIFSKKIEIAYKKMYKRYKQGLQPDHIVVQGNELET
jgi:predicted O-linked N-acetylglucosamine transferase (SPINDLY family)